MLLSSEKLAAVLNSEDFPAFKSGNNLLVLYRQILTRDASLQKFSSTYHHANSY
jgi:hypothetical protein